MSHERLDSCLHRDVKTKPEVVGVKACSHLMVAPEAKVSLKRFDPDSTAGFASKEAGIAALQEHSNRLRRLQELLYAEGKHCLLVVLQAMDAAGKDGTIRHVFNSFNPLGTNVSSFKVPTGKELSHDFLWRIHKAVPARARSAFSIAATMKMS